MCCVLRGGLQLLILWSHEGPSEGFPTVYVILLSVEGLKIIVGVRWCSINSLFVLYAWIENVLRGGLHQ